MSVTIAVAGNPNSGKTTLFNALTGSNQYVGNWPGVTVEKKEGILIGHPDVVLVDLPGIYSLSTNSLEEEIARDYLLESNPDAIINIVDGTSLERNLYLTTQLAELGIPMVLAINMMDEVEKSGTRIDSIALGEAFGLPVVKISALRETQIDELAGAAMEAAQKKGACCRFIVSAAGWNTPWGTSKKSPCMSSQSTNSAGTRSNYSNATNWLKRS
jgi:Fe2+ transport system protein B